jgi:DedD protein
MAFFKFRKSSDETPAAPLLHDSVEAMRRRATYRLIGSAVLVLIGVVGFPLLFDKQPRPISVDMPIDIPDRNKAKPLPLPATAAAAAAAVVPVPAASASAVEIMEEKSTAAPSSHSPQAPKVIAKAEPAPVAKPIAPAPKPVPKVDESEKIKALLNGQSSDPSSQEGGGRFVVQVGAFADPAKAREARLKLENAGLKTYTHVAQTKEGARTRVRVGPFSNKAEADKAAQKAKTLNLAAVVLTL